MLSFSHRWHLFIKRLFPLLSRKPKLFPVLCSSAILFSILAMPGAISANVFTTIVDGLAGAYLKLSGIDMIKGILVFWLFVSVWITKLAHSILIWLLGNPLPGISLTNPATNPIIQIGWTTLRDLTNMFFILGLAYIGLMTALDLSKFNTKKTFVNLLLIALLINFTPVICGAIVDFSNIIGTFFLGSISFSEVINTALGTFLNWDFAKDIFWEVLSGEKVLSNLVRVAGGAFIINLLGILFGLFALLLLLRIVFIWFLVIISPLAFFAWIFDGSKKYFKTWWGLFTQWATIIIPAGFFLYLTMHIFTLAPKMFSSPFQEEGKDFAFFASIAPVAIPTVFAIIGFIMTLKISTMGTAGVIGLGKTIKTKGLAAMKKMPMGTATTTAGVAQTVAQERARAKAAGKNMFFATMKGAVMGFGATGRTKGERTIGESLEAVHARRQGATARMIDEKAKRREARVAGDYQYATDEQLHDVITNSPFASHRAAAAKAKKQRGVEFTAEEQGKIAADMPGFDALGVKIEDLVDALSDDMKRKVLADKNIVDNLKLQTQILKSLGDKNKLIKTDEQFFLDNLAKYDNAGLNTEAIVKALSSENKQGLLQTAIASDNKDRQVAILETLSEQNRLNPEAQQVIVNNIAEYEKMGVKVDKLIKGASEDTKRAVYGKLENPEEQFKVLEALRKDNDFGKQEQDLTFLKNNADKFYNAGINLKDFAKAHPTLEPHLNIAGLDAKMSAVDSEGKPVNRALFDILEKAKGDNQGASEAQVKSIARKQAQKVAGAGDIAIQKIFNEMIQKRFDGLSDEDIKNNLNLSALDIVPYLSPRTVEIIAKGSAKRRKQFDDMIQKNYLPQDELTQDIFKKIRIETDKAALRADAEGKEKEEIEKTVRETANKIIAEDERLNKLNDNGEKRKILAESRKYNEVLNRIAADPKFATLKEGVKKGKQTAAEKTAEEEREEEEAEQALSEQEDAMI